MFRWRRLLCLLLVLSLLFSLSVGTAEASATGVLTLVSTGGAMGVGTGTFIASALPILPYILAGGIVVYSAVALSDDLQNIYQSLSASSKAELETITNAGTASFTMSGSLASELQTTVDNYYYHSGEFADTTWDGDITGCLPMYDSAMYDVYGNVKNSNYYNYVGTLGSTPLALPGTNLTATLGEYYSYFGTGTIVLHNTLTGVSLTFADGYFEDIYDEGTLPCASILIGTPGLQLNSAKECYDMVIPALVSCSIVESGGTCATHEVAYDSYEFYGRGYGILNFPFILNGTGISSIDGVMFNGYWLDTFAYTNTYFWQYHFAGPMTAEDYTLAKYLPWESVCADGTIPRVHDQSIDYPQAGTALYLPTAEALANANTLTRTGALTGQWDETLADAPTVDEGTNVGFWNKLWDWLSKILEAIRAIPGAIWDAIQSLIGAITGAIVSGLTTAFVPSTTYFDTYFADLAATFDGRMGILTYPTSVLYDFFESFLSIGEREPILTWESWDYQGNTVIPAGSYNLNDVLDYHPVFATIHSLYLIIVDASLVLALLRMLQRKYSSIISN